MTNYHITAVNHKMQVHYHSSSESSRMKCSGPNLQKSDCDSGLYPGVHMSTPRLVNDGVPGALRAGTGKVAARRTAPGVGGSGCSGMPSCARRHINWSRSIDSRLLSLDSLSSRCSRAWCFSASSLQTAATTIITITIIISGWRPFSRLSLGSAVPLSSFLHLFQNRKFGDKWRWFVSGLWLDHQCPRKLKMNKEQSRLVR